MLALHDRLGSKYVKYGLVVSKLDREYEFRFGSVGSCRNLDDLIDLDLCLMSPVSYVESADLKFPQLQYLSWVELPLGLDFRKSDSGQCHTLKTKQ